MRKFGLSQEGLKSIACVTMLIDHISAVFAPWVGLRIVGRVAFPIYCFLLCEGVEHTRDPKRYALRLGIGAVLSEVPYDLLFFGGMTWMRSSVMVTLLLGLFAVLGIRRCEKSWGKMLAVVVAVSLAELLGTDYGGMGILLIVLFAIPMPGVARLALMAVMCCSSDGITMTVLDISVPIQVFALLALLPIGLYSGQKRTSSRVLQWGFYLFYPVHLLALLVVRGTVWS